MTTPKERLIAQLAMGDLGGARLLTSIAALSWGICLLFYGQMNGYTKCSIIPITLGLLFIILSYHKAKNLITKDGIPVSEGLIGMLLWASSFGFEWYEYKGIESLFLTFPMMLGSWWIFIRSLVPLNKNDDNARYGATIGNQLKKVS